MSQSKTYSDLRVFGEITSGKLTVFGEYSLPTTDGLANQILVTDGAGNITFQNASAVALTPPSIVNGTGLNWSTVAPNTIQGNVTLAPFTTDNLAEGVTNLYYQDEYVDDRVNSLLIAGTGITKSYNDGANALTLGVTLAPFTTTNLAEGVNLYYTDLRVENRMASVLYKGGRGTGPDAISWTHVVGLNRIYPTVSLTPFTTDDLAEGATNLYLTENSLYDLMDQIIQDSASVTWTRNNITNQLTPNASTSMIEIQLDGSSIATNPTIDFISTPSITYTINDDIINGKTTIQIDSNEGLNTTLSNGNTTTGELMYYTDAMDAWAPGDSTTAINAAADNAFITKEWFYDNDLAVIIEGTGIGSSVRKDNLNNSLGDYSTVSGGSGNTASGDYSTIAGGTCNSVSSVGSFIGSGTNNIVSGDGLPTQITIVSSGPFAGVVDGTYAAVTTTSGSGTGTIIAVQIISTFVISYSLVSVGVNYQVGDTIIIDGADVGGTSGVDDITFTVDVVVNGGSVIGGGFNNDIFSIGSTISGGFNNEMCSHLSSIGGGMGNYLGGTLITNSFGLSNTIAGGELNSALGYNQTVGGGILNSINSVNSSTISGGDTNTIAIPGGFGATLGGSSIGGGSTNTILRSFSTIGGGRVNLVLGEFNTIGGGQYNETGGFNGAIIDFSTSTITSPIIDGEYTGYPTGGNGAGAQVRLVIFGGTVSSLEVLDGGSGYESGDVLTLVAGSPGSIDMTVGYTINGSASILGGAYNCAKAPLSTVGGGYRNENYSQSATIGGGLYNNIDTGSSGSVISGGGHNTISSYYTPAAGSTIGGGYFNQSLSLLGTIGGGSCNSISGESATIGGGSTNATSGCYSVIGGGGCNQSGGNAIGSTISGGYCNLATDVGVVIGGGLVNTASCYLSAIGGGFCNTTSGFAATVSGGGSNSALVNFSAIGGGAGNTSSGYASVIGGGGGNCTSGSYSVIGGGCCHIGAGNSSTIGGGDSNSTACSYSTIGGGVSNASTGNGSFVGGGWGNTASCNYSTIGGGKFNYSPGNLSTVSGGYLNNASGSVSIISGGCDNAATNSFTTISGGYSNTASNFASVVGGGFLNIASGYGSTVSGGSHNLACYNYGVIGGGYCNAVSGDYSAVLGGCCNSVTHNYAAAFGKSITSVAACTMHVNCLNLYDTPANSCTGTAFLVRSSDGMVKYRAYGGLFAQTGNSATLTNDTNETSIKDSGVGTLTVPANGFQVGDSFNAKMAGVISSQNGHTLTINIKSGSTVLATTGAMTLPNLTTQAWNLDVQFTTRAIGVSGAMHASGWFSYNSGGNHVGLNFNTTTSPFDTTASHTLDITATWGTASTNDAIYSTDFTLHKIF